MYRIFERSTEQELLSLQGLIAALDEDDRSRWNRHLNTTIKTGQPLDIEGCICCAEGRRRFVRLRGHLRHDQEGKLLGLLGTLTDISERKLIEECLFYDARHDSLTGISNRTYFMEQLNVAVELAKTDLDRVFSVLFIDLDRFMVHQFPVQVLKIDRSFTHRLAVDDRGIAMVQSILALAYNLGMTAIAEGGETEEQLGHLQRLNCPMAQGYYFSKPLPAPAAEQLMMSGVLGVRGSHQSLS